MLDSAIISFANEVSKLMPDIMREFLKRQTREVTRGNISLPQMLILNILKDRVSLRMGELAKYLGVSMAATTGIVDKLVRSGFALRSSSVNDRRIVNISITAQGKKIIQKHNQARQKALIEIFGSLSLADRNKYLEILSKIQRHLKETEQ